MANSGLTKTIDVLKNREFAMFVALRFIVIFALFVQATALSYHLYTITKDPLSLGLIGLAEVIPAFGFSLFAGHIADKVDKQWMYRICILAYFINAIFVSIITQKSVEHQLSISTLSFLIYLSVFLGGIARSFLAPVSFSILPMLVKRENYTEAITWSTSAWHLGTVLGPLAGGAILAWMQISVVMYVVIFCLILAIVFVSNISSKPATLSVVKENIWSSLQQGLRFVFSTKIVLAVMALDLFAVLFGGAEAMLPVFANEILKCGEVGYGWLRSAHGLGSILLTAILTFVPIKQQAGKKMLGSVFGFGLCIIAFGMSNNVYLSFTILFIGGMFDCVSVVIRQSILQLNTPTELKGRVASVNMIFISSSNELGAFESGVAAKMLGIVPSVIFGGIMTLVVVIFTFFSSKKLREMDL